LIKLNKRIGCWKPVVGILKMYQRGLAVAVRLLFKQTPLRSSDSHEPVTPACTVSKSLNSQGHFANLGYPKLLLTKLYKEQR
tara:strand:- start:699 stop:944 length:246 start_codon:yes stop_codon:yes gene_type:complete